MEGEQISIQPEKKTMISRRGRTSPSPTAWAQIYYCNVWGRWTSLRTVDGGGHWLWTNTMLLCRGMSGYRSHCFRCRGPGFCTDKRFFMYSRSGTNDHEQPVSVPFGPTGTTGLGDALTESLFPDRPRWKETPGPGMESTCGDITRVLRRLRGD